MAVSDLQILLSARTRITGKLISDVDMQSTIADRAFN